MTAHSRLASNIEWLKSREAMEGGTSFYPDDDYYDDDDDFYSEESLNLFVNFLLLTCEGECPLLVGIYCKDIVVCPFFFTCPCHP